MNRIQYKVVGAEEPAHLSLEIERMSGEGWFPLGGVAVRHEYRIEEDGREKTAGHIFYQAMIRESPPKMTGL